MIRTITIVFVGAVLLVSLVSYFLPPSQTPNFEITFDRPLKEIEMSRPDTLGRPVRWRQMGFDDSFFNNWHALNVSGDLDQESQKATIELNDTVAVALNNWAQIDEFPHSEILDIDVKGIRSNDEGVPFAVQNLLFRSNQTGDEKPYVVIFFSREGMERFAEECRDDFVYEAIRLIGEQEDLPKILQKNQFTECELKIRGHSTGN